MESESGILRDFTVTARLICFCNVRIHRKHSSDVLCCSVRILCRADMCVCVCVRALSGSMETADRLLCTFGLARQENSTSYTKYRFVKEKR
jgi:hypothetical protein